MTGVQTCALPISARVVEAGGGTERTVKGELRVKVPLVGSKVERAIVDGLREIATAQQRLVEDWLAGAG